jgi:tetratricopeptide (TPR) repeat protein/WD40 repeat protein
VASAWRQTLHLFDVGTGRLLFAPPSTPTIIWPPRLSPDGRRLAAVRDGPRVGLWSVGDGREYRVLAPSRMTHNYPPAVSPDGRAAAADFYGDGLVLFDLATGRELATVPFHHKSALEGRLGYLLSEPSGALLTNSMDGCFRWPLRPDPADAPRAGPPGQWRLGPPERLAFHPGISPIAASRDSRVVAQAMFAGYGMAQHAGGWILHPDRPGEPRQVAAGTGMGDAAVSPDGRWAAFGAHTAHVLVFEASNGRQVWRSPDGAARCLFTPDGRWLGTEVDGGRLYAVGTWEPGPRLGAGVLRCFSPDSRLAVLAMHTGSFRLVEVETGRELARLEDPERHAGAASFMPDGTKLVATAKDGLRVWDLRAIRHELAALGLDWDAPPYPPEVRRDEPGGSPLRVEVVGAELLDPKVRAWWALAQSTRQLLDAPDDLPARQRRAAAAQQLGWSWLAARDFTGILNRQPDHRAARYQRGLIALRQRRPADALADFDDLLRRDPGQDPARYRRALALIDLDRCREAITDLDQLVPKHPEAVELYVLRGQCHDRLGDRARAEADLRKALALAPGDAQAANTLAWHYVTGPERLRDPAKALPLARKAVERSPGRRTYHNTLGVVLYRLGQYPEAVKYLSESLEHTAAESAAYDLYVLAMCHHRLGDAAPARDCFDRAERWVREQQGRLTANEGEELNAFRVEAAELLRDGPRP